MTAFLPGFQPPSKLRRLDVDEPRDYQFDIDAAASKALATYRSHLVIAATGLGKTRVITLAISHSVGRVLVVAPSIELVEQARKRIERDTGELVEIERAELRAGKHARIVVCSRQTMGKLNRLSRFPPDHFGTIIIDEAHFSVVPECRAIIDHFANAKLIGFTATPDREDEVGLGDIYESFDGRFHKGWGIREGWLVPEVIESIRIDEIDLTNVSATKSGLNEAQVDAVMASEKVLHGLTKALFAECGDRQTMVFSGPGIATAERHAEVMNRQLYGRTGCARCITSKTDAETRARTFADFERGDFQFLVVVNIGTTGYDFPGIRCIAMCRPITSRLLVTQITGRGDRPLFPSILRTAEERRAEIAASAKPDVVIFDFYGKPGKHSLATVFDIFKGTDSDEVIDRAKKITRKGGRFNVEDVMAQAAAELAREAELAEKRKAIVAAKVDYTKTRINPFDAFGGEGKADPWAARFASAPSPAQLSGLERWKIPVPEKCTKAQASKLLSTAIFRANKGLANFRQTRELAAHGINAHKISMVNAGRLLAALDRYKTLSSAQVNEILGVRQRDAGEDDERIL